MTAAGEAKEFVRPPLTPALLDQAYEVNVEFDLITATQAGDAAAFGTLYERHVGAIQGKLENMCRPDMSLAEDLTQETFLRAFSKIHQLTKKDEGAGKWLQTIARNAFLDHVRRAGRLEFESMDSSLLLANPALESERASARQNIPFEELLITQIDLRNYIHSRFDAMPSKFAHLLFWVDYGDLSYRETAPQLGIPLGTVQSGVHRARKHFAEEPIPEGYKPAVQLKKAS
jgi:RNA polymerase sigma-70 factor (ECF subfamily)